MSSTLHEAARNNMLEDVQRLLDNGADPNAKDSYLKTPLHILSEKGGNLDIVRLIIQRGGKVSEFDLNGDTPIITAIVAKNIEVLDELLKQGYVTDKYNETPLTYALRNGYSLNIIKKILEYYPDINQKSVDGNDYRTPLFSALHSSKPNLEVVKELIKSGASILETNSLDETSLHVAVTWCTDLNFIQDIINAGVYVKSKNKLGQSVLFKALMNKSENSEILMELVRLGNSFAESDKRGNSLLHVALSFEKPLSIVQEILRHGVDVNQMNVGGLTPIFCACDNECDNLDIIRLLLKHGASVLREDLKGQTPLHFAVRNKKKLQIIEKLLEYGSDLNAKDKNGNTPFSDFKKHYFSWLSIYNDLLFDYGASIHKSFEIDTLIDMTASDRDNLIKFALIEHPDTDECNYCENLDLQFDPQFYKSEISEMKRRVINIDENERNITLYDYVVGIYDYGRMFKKENDFLSNVKSHNVHFNMYYPYFLSRLETRTYLLKCISDNDIKKMYPSLNSDCFEKICKSLSKRDLRCLLSAFSNHTFLF